MLSPLSVTNIFPHNDVQAEHLRIILIIDEVFTLLLTRHPTIRQE
jgi:hypothetical protein